MKTHRITPWLVILSGIVAAMHVGKIPPTIPILQRQLSLSLNETGFLLSAIQVAGMTCSLMVGVFASKLGIKRMAVLGSVVLALSSFIGSQTHDFRWLFVARLGEGFGFLCVVLSVPPILKQILVKERVQSMMAYWSTYMGFGVAISLLLVPLLLMFMHWPQVWQSYAGLSLLMAGLLMYLLPSELNHKPAQAVSMRHVFKETLSHPAPWLLGLLFGCYTSQWFAVLGFLPSIYAAANIAPAQAGVLTALISLSNVIGPVLAGTLLHRGVSPLKLLLTGFVVMAIGAYVAFAGAGHWPVAVQFLGVLMFSAIGGLIPGVVFAFIVYLAPSQHSVASTTGWMQQISAFAQFSLPPILGALVSWWGSWHNAWMVCAVLGVVGMVLAKQLQRLISQIAE